MTHDIPSSVAPKPVATLEHVSRHTNVSGCCLEDDLRVEVTVDEDAALSVGQIVVGLRIPPVTFWVVQAADVDVQVVALKILPSPMLGPYAGTDELTRIVRPGDVGDLVIKEDDFCGAGLCRNCCRRWG